VASEREKAKEEYLRVRESALKTDKRYRLSKVWMDTHYLLCGGAIIAAAVAIAANWVSMSPSWRVCSILISVAGTILLAALGAVPTKQMLRRKKELHELKRKMADLEDRYHL